MRKKIVILRRSFMPNPIDTSSVWLIPTSSYMLGKFNGVIYGREFIWWIILPTLFLGWLLLNFKIKK